MAAPTLTGCGLFDGGSRLDEAFEYLPADSYSVVFTDRQAIAERKGVDDIDPRDVSEDDIERYRTALEVESNGTILSGSLAAMQNASFNEFDIVWEAETSWGDFATARGAGHAMVWKVTDDFDFDALAEELSDLDYSGTSTGEAQQFTANDAGAVGGTYTWSHMLLVPDEQLVAGTAWEGSLDTIAGVAADDVDSLADDGEFDDLAEVAGEAEHVALTGGAATCGLESGHPIPERFWPEYADLEAPARRALVISSESAESQFVLEYAEDSTAEDDVDARRQLVAEGIEPQGRQPFSALGEFDVERDGDLIVVSAEYERGPQQALSAFIGGTGPDLCLPD